MEPDSYYSIRWSDACPQVGLGASVRRSPHCRLRSPSEVRPKKWICEHGTQMKRLTALSFQSTSRKSASLRDSSDTIGTRRRRSSTGWTSMSSTRSWFWHFSFESLTHLLPTTQFSSSFLVSSTLFSRQVPNWAVYLIPVLWCLLGMGAIKSLESLLNSTQPFSHSNFRIHTLHSSIPASEQKAIFPPPKPGVRKVRYSIVVSPF